MSINNRNGFLNITLVVGFVVVISVVGCFAFVKKFTPMAKQTLTQISNTQAQTPKITSQSIGNIFQSKSDGCGNIFVYKTNKDDTTGISVSANTEKIKLSTAPKTFNIDKTNSLKVELLMGQNIKSLYCNDAVKPNLPEPKKLIGKTGKVIISISKVDESQPVNNRNYTATVILRDIHFTEENGNNSNIIVDELVSRNVRVGWLPG